MTAPAQERYPDDEDDYCYHECDENCEDGQGFRRCDHSHCIACGDCGCAGYCDNYRTYNLRPTETGGDPWAGEPS